MGKWKVIGYSLLGLIIVGTTALGFEYQQLQPKNHFKTIPVMAGGNGKTGEKGKAGGTGETQSPKQQTNSNDPAFNILVMGSDEEQGETIGHSDTMMLVHVDLGKNQVNAVSIPRDTRVYLDGYGYTKLTSVQYILQANHGPSQGIKQAVQAISELTGVPVNYYVETNFAGLQSMVDAMGGIQLNVPMDVTINNQVVKTGIHYFDGQKVLALVRERYSQANGDYGRQQLQLETLKGIAKEALSPANMPKLPSLINSVSKYMIGTNMSTSDMLSLGLAMKNIDPNRQVHYLQLQGTEESMYDDILKAKNDEIVIDPQQMKNMIGEYFQS